jgi:hypothetical protein
LLGLSETPFLPVLLRKSPNHMKAGRPFFPTYLLTFSPSPKPILFTWIAFPSSPTIQSLTLSST